MIIGFKVPISKHHILMGNQYNFRCLIMTLTLKELYRDTKDKSSITVDAAL